MANSADPDQLASSEASWSGSTLFAKAGYIRVQQDKGSDTSLDRTTTVISNVCSKESNALLHNVKYERRISENR